jgi:hypothetical protein
LKRSSNRRGFIFNFPCVLRGEAFENGKPLEQGSTIKGNRI